MCVKLWLQVCQERHLKWEGGIPNGASWNRTFLLAFLRAPAVGQTDADSELQIATSAPDKVLP